MLEKPKPSESDLFKRNPVSYSIWLIPEGSIHDKLKNSILSLSSNFGGPTFEPHVTLVSSFLGIEKQLLQKMHIISQKIKPFEICFDEIAYLDEYFCSLFLKVKFSSQLRAYIDIARKELSWNNNGYIPQVHLSLAYGNYGIKEKKEMISTLDLLPDRFIVNKIFLAHNDEIKLEWKVIQEFKLVT